MIAVASDHTGYELKQHILKLLKDLGEETLDLGTNSRESAHFPVYGEKAARAVASGQCGRGIVICGTGIGISLAANSIPGIRCAVCNEIYCAEMARRHNDANMLALGARVVGVEVAKAIVRIFIASPYDGGVNELRLRMLEDLKSGKTLG